MNLSPLTEKLLAAKQRKGLSFADLSKQVGRNEIWVAAAFYRLGTASEEEAKKIADALDLLYEDVKELCKCPTRGLGGPAIPTDPVLYRFYEAFCVVYGMPIKEIIHEKFGDGIMSAIDFTIDIERKPDPKGDRVLLTLDGKFLPYKKW